VNFYRLLVPYLVGGGILSTLLWSAGNYWIPNGNKKRVRFDLAIKKDASPHGDPPGRLWNEAEAYPTTPQGKLIERLMAKFCGCG
jgi:hypothetical protein